MLARFEIDGATELADRSIVERGQNIEAVVVRMRGTVCLAVLVLFLVGLASASVAHGRDASGCRLVSDDDGHWLTAEANLDLYNGILFAGGGGAVSLMGNPNRRWSARNAFDMDTRHAFRLAKPGSRRRADLASDVTLVASLAVLPALSIGVQQWRTGDCAESWDMATDFVESFGLVLLVSESIKLASGRERPFATQCGPDAPSDAACRGGDRFRSFISGHATLAATGAGLTCAWSVRRKVWGESFMARAAPCGAGVTLALATGSLRVAADRHWMTDVLAGFVIGSAVGYFDTWGPFDLLRFGDAERSATGRPARFGFVLPGLVEGAPGVRALFVF